MIVTHVEKGSQITMKDGSYKSIEDILPGDDVQTYVMGGEDFDSANISNNEQKNTKVMNCGKSTEEMPLVKINFESVSFKDDGFEEQQIQLTEKVKSESSLVMNSTGVMMGGDNIGWVIPDFDRLTNILVNEENNNTEEVADWGNQLEVGMDVSADSDKSLMNKEVVSIEEVSDVETYYIDGLKDGDSIFANDVLVLVDRGGEVDRL